MSIKAPDYKIIAVLPAYNAEKTLKKTLDDIDQNWVDEIILVDDASQDNTVKVAKKLGINTFRHQRNLGYGGNQKTCYQQALKLEADIVIMVHPDHQYDPTYIPQIVLPIIRGRSDAVFGSRMMVKGWALEGGMPFWKYLANILLTKIENLVLGLKLTEYHSGFRAYSRQILKIVPFKLNSNDFVFDTEIIIQLKIHGFKIREIPITTRYFKEASMIGFKRSIQYGLDVLKALLDFVLSKWRIKKDPRFIK
ncbi:glycosyltransferase family 2 protein [Patescibacteria group bacterium]|nr:glycosyltransferase family 2 protein [Patescibacteria group bacterium]